MRVEGNQVGSWSELNHIGDWVAEETLHSPEVAEKALAHAIANKVESAYRRGDLLEPRRRLMADWERHCLEGNPSKIEEKMAA